MFAVYGPGITDRIPLEQLFAQPAVRQAAKVQSVGEMKQQNKGHASVSQQQVQRAYQAGESSLRERRPALRAEQMMTRPVVSLLDSDSAQQALKLLSVHDFRHIPIVSEKDGRLVGMVSDRDVYRCMCGTSICLHCSKDAESIRVGDVMKAEVLAAQVDTEARYIARLFVEEKVGAMPIVAQAQLVGMVTRSDILRAVMQHFDLDVWQ